MKNNVRRLTKAFIYTSALILGLSFTAAAEHDDFDSRYAHPDQERTYDYNYRENTGGDRDHRYMPSREFHERDMERNNRGYYDDDREYDYNYRENTGGSMDSRYMPRDEPRGHMMDREMNRGYYDNDNREYDYNYRENTGGSMDSRYGSDWDSRKNMQRGYYKEHEGR